MKLFCALSLLFALVALNCGGDPPKPPEDPSTTSTTPPTPPAPTEGDAAAPTN